MRRIIPVFQLLLIGTIVNAQQLAPISERIKINIPEDQVVPSEQLPLNINNPALSKSSTVNTWYDFLGSLDADPFFEADYFAPYMFFDTTVVYGVSDQGQLTSVTHIRFNSFGAVFDPKDEAFNNDNNDDTKMFSIYNPYTVDSIRFFYLYDRRLDSIPDTLGVMHEVVDTLVLQLFNGSNNNIERWYIGDQNNPDSRFGTVQYDINTGLAINATQTIKIPLTGADTAVSVFRYFQREAGLQVPMNGIAAAIYTFIPGYSYSFGDTLPGPWSPEPLKPLNSFRPLIGFDQSNLDITTHNNGIVINYQQRNNPNWLVQTSPTRSARYIPGSLFGNPLYPHMEFKISSTNVSIGNARENIINGLKAYPNPAPNNSEITFEFSLGNSENVSIELYNMLGQKVADITNDNFAAGTHSVKYEAAGLRAGVYFYTIKAGTNSSSFKLNIIE